MKILMQLAFLLIFVEGLGQVDNSSDRQRKLEETRKLTEQKLFEKAQSTRDTVFIHEYFRKYPKGQYILETIELLAPFDDPAGTVNGVAPDYPRQALARGLGARMLVLIRIDKNGRPVEWLHLKKNRIFQASVEKAIRETTYAPAVKDGKAVMGWILQSYNFGFN